MEDTYKKLLGMLIIALSAGILITGCADNSTGTDGTGNDDDGGTENPPPTEPTYANVQSILTNSCGGSGCHITSTTNGVRLNNYENIMNSVGSQYGKKVVVPGDAAASPLVDKIEPNPEIGDRMPQGGPYLSSDQINLIKEWINNGAKNE
jgi:hypothetical protein